MVAHRGLGCCAVAGADSRRSVAAASKGRSSRSLAALTEAGRVASSVGQVLELVVPTVALEAAWREAHAEWGLGTHEDGFGLDASDDVTSDEGFADWVRRLIDAASEAHDLDARCSYRWIVEPGRVLGGIALGHGLSKFRLHARGQIGFGVRPSARGRGVATWALRQTLASARELGLDRVLLVCADDNAASAKTIERCGGLLEDVRDTDLGLARRYWIELNAG